MTSATTTPEETTWVSDFGPIPYDSLNLANHQYEVRSYWLADFRLKAIGEALAFAAKFDSPEVFSAYLDIKGDEGYIYFEIKANTRPQTLSLRYAADRWSAVDGRGAHTPLKNSHSETAVKSRGVLTVFHAFLDAALLNTICEQLEITPETQSKLLVRINFKEKTYSLVASEEAVNDFPSQKPYKTSIIPISPIKAGESMNAQEEKAEATQTQTASAEPSATETAASGSSTTEAGSTTPAGDVSSTEIARAEIVAWATEAEAAAEDKEKTASESAAETAPASSNETQAPVEASVESAAPIEGTPAQSPAAVEAAAPEMAPPAEAPAQVEPPAQVEAVETPVDQTPPPAASPAADQEPASAEAAAPSETPSVQTAAPGEAAPAASQVETAAPAQAAAPQAATPAPVETPAEAEAPKKPEVWRTPAEIRAEKSPGQNAAKNSDSGVLGKLAAKTTDDRSANRDKKDNRDARENSKDSRDNNAPARSNSPQGRTNFAPQNNRSIEAPRPVDNTPKYHTYSQSEVDSLIKKSAENVSNSVASKINKQTKLVEETLKNQDFAFKQALETINKQAEIANQKLDKAVVELTSASTKQKDEYKDAFAREIEEFKKEMNKKVNQGVKVIDSKLEQLSEVKKPKPAPAPKAAATATGGPNKALIAAIGIVALLALANILIMIGAIDRITKLESASPTTKSSATEGEVPVPDLMKDQIKQENTTAPAPVQP